MSTNPKQRPTGIAILAVVLGCLAVAGFGNAFVWRSIPDEALSQLSAAPAIPMLHAAASPYFSAIAIAYGLTALLSCVALWRMHRWASQMFISWIVSVALLSAFILWNAPKEFYLVSSLFMFSVILVLGFLWTYVHQSVVVKARGTAL